MENELVHMSSSLLCHQQPSSLSTKISKWYKYTSMVLYRHWVNILMIKVFSLKTLYFFVLTASLSHNTANNSPFYTTLPSLLL